MRVAISLGVVLFLAACGGESYDWNRVEVGFNPQTSYNPNGAWMTPHGGCTGGANCGYR